MSSVRPALRSTPPPSIRALDLLPSADRYFQRSVSRIHLAPRSGIEDMPLRTAPTPFGSTAWCGVRYTKLRRDKAAEEDARTRRERRRRERERGVPAIEPRACDLWSRPHRYPASAAAHERLDRLVYGSNAAAPGVPQRQVSRDARRPLRPSTSPAWVDDWLHERFVRTPSLAASASRATHAVGAGSRGPERCSDRASGTGEPVAPPRSIRTGKSVERARGAHASGERRGRHKIIEALKAGR